MVENRPGASSSVAAEAVSRAAPDGLILLLAVNAVVLNAAVHPSLPYALPDSFAPVGTFCTAPNLFWCAANQPWRDLEAVAAAARAAPGTLAYGTTGVGGTGHFGGETVCRALGVSLTHVPYRGTAPLMQDVAGGRVPLLSHGIAGLVGPFNRGISGRSPCSGRSALRSFRRCRPWRNSAARCRIPACGSASWPRPGRRPASWRAWRATWRHSPAPPIPARNSPPRARCRTSWGRALTARIRTELATWREIARSAGIKPE